MTSAAKHPVILTKRPQGRARRDLLSTAAVCVVKEGPSASLGATDRKGDMSWV